MAMNKLMLIPLLLAVFAAPAFAYITITQDSPLGSGTTYYTKNLSINFTIDTDGTLDKCWRFNDNTFTGWQTNISIVDCKNTSYIALPCTNYFIIWANTTSGEVNCSTYGFSEACDTADWLYISPSAVGILNLTFPKNITYQYPQDVDLNFTPQFTESGITSTSCEYQLDSGGWSGLGDCYSNSTLTSLTETQHDVQTRMDIDSCGSGLGDYLLSPDIFFTLGNVPDNTPPIVSIQAPSGSVTSPFDVNFTAEDETALDSCWYSVDSGSNVSIPSCSNFTDSASLGSHNITIYANDTSGNTGSDTNAFAAVDLLSPVVAVQSPSGAYSSGTTSVPLNFTATDNIAINACWYRLNNGSNTTIASCANTTVAVTAGSYNITVYANDTSNNIGSDTSSFNVHIPPPITGLTAGIVVLLLPFVGVFSILAVVRRIEDIENAEDMVNLAIIALIAVAFVGVLAVIMTGLV